MNSALLDLVQTIHGTAYKIVLVTTGGGASAGSLLLSISGGSKTVLELLTPYDSHALRDFVGYDSPQACSAETALAMAARAYDRAVRLAPGLPAPGSPVLGVACTASLVSDRPKHGDHRFFIAACHAEKCVISRATLNKGARNRAGEEEVVALSILNAISSACGANARVVVPFFPAEIVVDCSVEPGLDPVAAWVASGAEAICLAPDGRIRDALPRSNLVLPGSFNPVHAGHWDLARAAELCTGREAAFELSVINVDKPALSPPEVRARANQFNWRRPLWLTRAPTFAEKAALFPGATFVVGLDTAKRIIEPRYYGIDPAALPSALERVRACGCRFLVAGRLTAEGAFATLADLDLPERFSDLFEGLPDFRNDFSSSQIRRLGV